jgi:hypothetical protein
MGVNAQTSVPTFTAGSVLTAQQQNWINTGIPVFATTVTRDAAFGGTGEKTLAQGQYAYIEATSTLQVYNGSAWVTVGSGLALVKSQTIGSAVSSVTVTGAFSADYDNYKIILSGGVGSATQALRLSLGAAATGYYSGGLDTSYGGGNAALNQSNAAFWNFGGGSTNLLSGTAEIHQPFLADQTTYFSNYSFAITTANTSASSGFLNDTTSYTSLTITPSTGTMTGGTIRVYGYANS